MSKSKNTAAKIEESVIAVQERIRPPVDEKGRFKSVDMTMEEIGAHNFKTKSAQIRYLHSQNYSPMAIAKFMNIIYQHVRNVLNQQVKRPTETTVPAPVQDSTEESKD